MERYFKRIGDVNESSNIKRLNTNSKEKVKDVESLSEFTKEDDNLEENHDNIELSSPTIEEGKNSGNTHDKIDLTSLPADPGMRTPILDYHPNIRDQVRRAYLLKGPCQPRTHTFPLTLFGKKARRFNPAWFNEHANWLEYSISKDAVFCLYCYLFFNSCDSFVGEGFSNWKKKERLQTHVGGINSVHNNAVRNGEALLRQEQHIETVLCKHSDEVRKNYRIRLNASVDCVRFLLKQGLPFRGHDESECSSNRGNFIELLQWLRDKNDGIKAVTMEEAPENLKLVSPKIQRDISNAISFEIIDKIIRELGESRFSILIDESRDISTKEQMAMVLRYVHEGEVIERFVGIEHVSNTTSLALKTAIDDFFSRHGLSMDRLRGQGYDGANNMQGEFNGLKTLILRENGCAYFVHCFAHQLQLAVVAVARKHTEINDLFILTVNVVNIVGASPKRRDLLREKHSDTVFEALNNNELFSGQGLNQETSLVRAGDTRWGSHHRTLVSLINMFSATIDVLEMVADDTKSDKKFEARVLLTSVQSFNFVLCLHLTKNILGITNDLSQALQRKDQEIVNAMKLVTICKLRLQEMRDSGWDCLLNEVSSFCEKHNIGVPNMEDMFILEGRPRRKTQKITNIHHYRVELFYTVVDLQLQELNNRFNEVNTELLICLASLSPIDSFAAFDKQKLIQLAKFYPKDFSSIDLRVLEDQLENYLIDMQSSNEFLGLKGLVDLAKKMKEKRKDKVYPLVYMLLTLALTLPVATATVERVFSSMNIIKNRLRNRMGDEWMNDNLLAYVERDIFDSIDNEVIMQRFQKMKTRRGQL